MKLQFEKIRHKSHESFYSTHSISSDIVCPYHFHPELELTYIEHGHGTRIIGSNISEFSEGDLMLIGSNVPHWYYNAPEDSTGKDWARTYVVQFLPNFLGDFFLQIPELRKIQKHFSDAKAGIRISGDTNKRIVEKLQKLQTLSGYERLLKFLEILQCINHARKDLEILKQETRKNKLNHLDAERFDKIFRYINEHSSEDIRLEAIAKIAGMTPPAFSRFYKQKTGKTFQQTLIETRLLSACQQLITSNRSIVEICFASGFNNLSNFNRQFKRNKACSPKDFRSKWKKG